MRTAVTFIPGNGACVGLRSISHHSCVATRPINTGWRADSASSIKTVHPGQKIRDGKQGSGSEIILYYGKLVLTINEFNMHNLDLNTFKMLFINIAYHNYL
jgi:hypothetical protein